MLANTQKINELKQVQCESLFSSNWTRLHVTCRTESGPILRQFKHQYQTTMMPTDAKFHHSFSGFKEDTRKWFPILPTHRFRFIRAYLHPCPQWPHPVSWLQMMTPKHIKPTQSSPLNLTLIEVQLYKSVFFIGQNGWFHETCLIYIYNKHL